MKAYIIGAIVLLLLAVGVFIYIFKIETYYIDLGDNQLKDVLDMHFFEGVKPIMTKQDVIRILGKTTRIHIEREDGDKHERWEWGRPQGIMNYYFEPTQDGGIGTPEFLPNNLSVNELFFEPLQFQLITNKKYIIELKRKNKLPCLTVRTLGEKVTRINYFFSKDVGINLENHQKN